MQELYDMLNTKIGTKEVYKITIIKFAKRKYVSGIPAKMDGNRQILRYEEGKS